MKLYKKTVLYFLILGASIAKAEINLNEIAYVEVENETKVDKEHTVPMEWGVRGLEFAGIFTNISTDLKKEKYYSLYHKYLIQETMNKILFEDMKNDNLDREHILKFGYNHLNIDSKNSNGFNLLFGTLLDENKKIGVNLNYYNLNYKSEMAEKDIKAHMYSGNIFYYFRNEENMSDIFINIYGGSTKNKKSSINEKSQFMGGNFIYSKNIEKLSNYDYFETRYFIRGDLSRTRYKIDDLKENNDSMNVDVGIDTSKEINLLESKSRIGVNVAYSHEFMPKRKYKSFKEKDPYEGAVKGSIYGEVKISEVLEIRSDYNVKIGTAKSKIDNSISVGLKIKI